jgi:hypothetical protein
MKKIITFLLSLTGFIAHSQGSFFPLEAKKYVVSGWVKEATTQQPLTYTSNIQIQFFNAAIAGTTPIAIAPPIVMAPQGEIIDGWQHIVGIIETPSGYTDPSIAIVLNCTSIYGTDCFYDDIRFLPYDGNLKSFVYDEDTERLLAELDENNYATFYEYDQEGGLVRVKKETEKGVFTIQETRSNTFKK